MPTKKSVESVVIFGGAGLVGYQIGRKIATELAPKHIVLCSLFEAEAKQSAEDLKREFPSVERVDFEFGNIFVREEYARRNRQELLSDSESVRQIHEDVFGNLNDDKDNIDKKNLMGQIIRKYSPDVVVDCVNTATGISYQDVKSSSQVVRRFSDALGDAEKNQNLSNLVDSAKGGDKKSQDKAVDALSLVTSAIENPIEGEPDVHALTTVNTLLISQAVPQLVRHVTLLQRALLEVGTQVYIKVGTTGTGGMGINIPYTHGEDKPSFTLMAKSSVGFAHTGLLFLLARTPGPIIKEVKPGAMIGYKKVWYKPITKYGKLVELRESKSCALSDQIDVREDEATYKGKGQLKMAGIDTGENGFFSRGEFEAITYLNQMEFVTPEEIARTVVAEIKGHNTGKDVIAAVDGAVMDPSYRAGYLRHDALERIQGLESETNSTSVAIGELGPPQLSKLLYESHLLEVIVKQLSALADSKLSAEDMAEKLEEYVMNNEIRETITSLGLPILLRDGKTILRGPSINIPESKVDPVVPVHSADDIDAWAQKGWVDLRVENMKRWKQRAEKMLASQSSFQTGGSADMDTGTYMHRKLKIGAMVGWIFINEFGGARIK